MLHKEKALGSGRFAHLDLLRLIACFLVVFNHTQGCIKLYEYDTGALTVLLILPFLRSIAVRMNTRDVFYLIGVRFIIGAVIPMLFLIANSITGSNMHIAHEFQPAIIIVDCVFYPLIGYGLDRCFDEKETFYSNRILLTALFVAAGILGAVAFLISGGGESFDGFVFIMVISVFVFVKKSVLKSGHRADGVISALGALTFGIYLLDPVIGPFFKKFFDFKGDYKMFWSSIVYCFFSMTLGGLLTFLFKAFKKKIFHK